MEVSQTDSRDTGNYPVEMNMQWIRLVEQLCLYQTCCLALPAFHACAVSATGLIWWVFVLGIANS